MEKISTFKFFDLVMSGELGMLDIDNYIDILTDNYKLNKLKMLLYDIEYCLFCDKEERDAGITDEDIQKACETLKSQNKEIPYRTIGPLRFNKADIAQEGTKVIDLQQLFYPWDYMQIYKIIGKLKYQIKLQETEKPAVLIPQLNTNLTTDQINKLFKLLVDGKFIPTDTDPDSFYWIFGATDQPQPGHFKPVIWKEANRGLRELLTPILGTISNRHKKDIKQLFIINGKPFVICNPKTTEFTARCTDIEKIIKGLNL